LTYSATLSRFVNGGLAEIFLTNHKAGSAADAAAKDAAVVCSIALQYGVPLDTLRNAQGEPSSALGVALDMIGSSPQ
jgi:hypothetical protein